MIPSDEFEARLNECTDDERMEFLLTTMAELGKILDPEMERLLFMGEKYNALGLVDLTNIIAGALFCIFLYQERQKTGLPVEHV